MSMLLQDVGNLIWQVPDPPTSFLSIFIGDIAIPSLLSRCAAEFCHAAGCRREGIHWSADQRGKGSSQGIVYTEFAGALDILPNMCPKPMKKDLLTPMFVFFLI